MRIIREHYGMIGIEHGNRRLLHVNVTEHPSAAWTLQQLREVVGLESRHRFLIHDRDSADFRSAAGESPAADAALVTNTITSAAMLREFPGC